MTNRTEKLFQRQTHYSTTVITSRKLATQSFKTMLHVLYRFSLLLILMTSDSMHASRYVSLNQPWWSQDIFSNRHLPRHICQDMRQAHSFRITWRQEKTELTEFTEASMPHRLRHHPNARDMRHYKTQHTGSKTWDKPLFMHMILAHRVPLYMVAHRATQKNKFKLLLRLTVPYLFFWVALMVYCIYRTRKAYSVNKSKSSSRYSIQQHGLCANI